MILFETLALEVVLLLRPIVTIVASIWLLLKVVFSIIVEEKVLFFRVLLLFLVSVVAII